MTKSPKAKGLPKVKLYLTMYVAMYFVPGNDIHTYSHIHT